jgi:hypothetical protein
MATFMPSLSQSLFWIYFHVEAKNSTLTNTPTQIWHYPSKKEIEKIINLNWYDFHQMYTITFIVDLAEEKPLPFPIIASFFFLDPKWVLVDDLQQTLNKCWRKSKLAKAPSLICEVQETVTPSSWFLLKQNDPDLLRLMVASIIQNKLFMPPFSNYVFTPLGVTPPIVKPKSAECTKLNLDPTSSHHIKGGHNSAQKLCNSNGFLTRQKIPQILSDKVG